MTGSLNVLPWYALYMRKAQRQKPPTISSKSTGNSTMKKSPFVMAPRIIPAIAQTIQKPIQATLKKMDWKAWKRTKRSGLNGSISKKMMPVINPARYASAAATFGCSPKRPVPERR